MAARNWTPEQRARQAEAIRAWQPWQHSTGARTPEGKAISSRNAFRSTIRKHLLFARWLLKQGNRLRAGKPCATTEETRLRGKLFGVDV
jgi:hypothetical protein